MRRGVSIKGLMAAVSVAAACLAALANPTQLRSDILLFFTQVILLTGTVGALFHRGRRRVIWTGFSLFGWFYFLLYFAPLFADRTGMVVPTHRAYERAFEYLHPLDDLLKAARANPGASASLRSTYNEMAENFHQAAHLQATLLFALLGAFLSSVVVERRRPPEDDPSAVAPGPR